MILVDVFVPSLNNNYEFQLDENVRIELVIEEITEMICQKEHCSITGNKNELFLCRCQGESVLSRNSTLAQNQITDGGRLILV